MLACAWNTLFVPTTGFICLAGRMIFSHVEVGDGQRENKILFPPFPPFIILILWQPGDVHLLHTYLDKVLLNNHLLWERRRKVQKEVERWGGETE